MKLIRNIAWSEVWQTWQKNEQKIWEPFYKAKSFNTWADWRKIYVKALKLDAFDWQLYQVDINEVKTFKCGAFKGWLTASESVNSRCFIDLAQADIFKSYPKIEAIKADFPSKIDLIACKYQNEIYLIEGNHRCLSICQMLLTMKPINTNIQLALTVLPAEKEYPYIHFYP